MKQKGVYPCDFMDSFTNSDEKYHHVQNIWNTFNLKSMGEYHDLYLKTDILLLTDVFQNFRKKCTKYLKLDTCHYLKSHGLSWDAILKMTYG